ncbi:MAG TPA: hypothetical protein VMB73_17445 [Acetobacteraceae bacterium]|jgi:alkylhydroperoxidase family enzyme|nr:hypothetical protein [Acetobacteraceae bacterium]
MTADAIAAQSAIGIDDLDIHDLTNAGAMFATTNRLMQTLGEPALPDDAALRSDA